MSSLSQVLEAVLTEITAAQHAANLYSEQLANGVYQTSPLLSRLAVPNASLSELSLELRFAIRAVTAASSMREDEASSASAQQEFATTAVQAALDSVDQVLRAGEPFHADPPRIERIRKHLQGESLHSYLVESLLRALRTEPHLRPARIAAQNLRRNLLEHPDLAFLFNAGTEASHNLMASCSGEIASKLGSIPVRERMFETPGPTSSLDLAILDADLKDADAANIHTLKLTLHQSNDRWEFRASELPSALSTLNLETPS